MIRAASVDNNFGGTEYEETSPIPVRTGEALLLQLVNAAMSEHTQLTRSPFQTRTRKSADLAALAKNYFSASFVR